MFDWLAGAVTGLGYPGLALLMFAENVFPPIPSELIMPMAGYAAARGEMGLGLAVLAGSLGSLAGALLWYGVGRRVGAARLRRIAARHGRWLGLAPAEVDRAAAWFARHGGKAVLFGRMVPAVRTLISVPAGIARMALPRFLAASALGTAAWSGALAVAGYLLEGEATRIQAWLDPVSTAIVLGILAAWIYRVATFRPAADSGGPATGAQGGEAERPRAPRTG